MDAHTQGATLFNSRRTARCDRCARSEAGQSRLPGIDKLDVFAKTFGDESVSREFFGRRHRYEWRCKAAHVLLEDFSNLKLPVRFCSDCD
jgi:hypothetical protein